MCISVHPILQQVQLEADLIQRSFREKNRQVVILESLGKFGAPDWGKLTMPALVSESQAAAMIKRSQREIANTAGVIEVTIRIIIKITNSTIQSKIK